MRHIVTTALALLLVANCVLAQNKQSQNKKQRVYPPVLKGATVETYKKVDETELKVWIFKPAAHKSTDRRPAIVFFFGGGWRNGTPQQFEHQCRYLAKRGMVAMTADYRVSSRHRTKAKACVEDGKSAVRWVRQNAARLGVDPNRIVAGGGSAGGHVAACTGVITGFEAGEAKISSRPNALALFNPALVLAEVPGIELDAKRASTLDERMGVPSEKLSPWHHVNEGQPPTIVFHGKADTTVPYKTAEMFTVKMKKFGNRCELKSYDQQGHGFFNHGRAKNVMFDKTVKELDQFLVSLAYLGKP